MRRPTAQIWLGAYLAALLAWLAYQQEWAATSRFGASAVAVWWAAGLRDNIARRSAYQAEVVRILGMSGTPAIPDIVAEIRRVVEERDALRAQRRSKR